MIEIDGSYGEGGGQIIRTSLTLSAITQKPVRISGIRSGRPKPGLQPQHLMACKSVRSVCRGILKGAEIGGTEIVFEPGPIVGGRYDFDIGTAGSVTLVAQTLIPMLLKAGKASRLRIKGGTHVMKSPGFDYFDKVFVPSAARMGAALEARMVKAGYYPAGGGEIEVLVEPSGLKGCASWPAGEGIQAIIRRANLPEGIAIREKKIFVQNGIEKVFIREDTALSPGNAVTAWNGHKGSYSLGQKGKRAELVAQEALDGILNERFDVDMHLADQLMLYAALAEGPTRYRTGTVSEHLRTNAYVISRFIDREVRLEGNLIEVR
jgi:RNA 3'-terminal phosphate cyclase (ATP)